MVQCAIDAEQTGEEESKRGDDTRVCARVRTVCQVIRERNLEARIVCGSTQLAEEETGK